MGFVSLFSTYFFMVLKLSGIFSSKQNLIQDNLFLLVYWVVNYFPHLIQLFLVFQVEIFSSGLCHGPPSAENQQLLSVDIAHSRGYYSHYYTLHHPLLLMANTKPSHSDGVVRTLNMEEGKKTNYKTNLLN